MPLSISAIAQSGLNASTTRLTASAHNTANQNTPNFRPSQVEVSDVQGGGVKVSISQEARELAQPGREISRPDASSGTDPVRETLSRTLAATAFRANLKTLETSDALDATLMGLGLPERKRES